MDNLENLSNEELITLYKEESDYLMERFENRIKFDLYKKYKKYKELDIYIGEKVKTHRKNTFYVVYRILRNRKENYIDTFIFGCRNIKNKKQWFYTSENDFGIYQNTELNGQINPLTLINQHVFERYNERLELNLSEDYYVFMLLNELGKVTLNVNSITREVQLPVDDGLILGNLLEDGTILCKTFVNRLFTNQSILKYKLYKDEMLADIKFEKVEKLKKKKLEILKNEIKKLKKA